MTLAERAARALDLARSANPEHATRADSQHMRRHRAQLARTLAATLGVDPARVVATADPNRTYGGYSGHLLAVIDTDGATYRFIPATTNWDNAFCLLGPCPACEAEVPVTEIAQLADLGHYLEMGPSPTGFDDYRWDQNHRPDCPRAATD